MLVPYMKVDDETGSFLNTLVITNNGSSYITNYQQCHYQVQVEGAGGVPDIAAATPLHAP